jgi:uncharacterized membrane protein YfcA
LLLELIALGVMSGFLAGLLGIGGGMVMVPFLTLIMSTRGAAPDLAVKMAIATSMATIVFTSIASVRAHHKKGAVRWDIVRGLTPGIVLGSLISSLGLFALLKGSYLAVFFGLFVGFSATQMFLDKKPKPSRQMPQAGGRWVAGGLIGLLSGLVGAGGGFISVPFMAWCNVATALCMATLHQAMKGTLMKPPPAPTSPDKKPISPPANHCPLAAGICRLGLGFLSKNIWVAEKPTNRPKKMASELPLSRANSPRLLIRLPTTMPGAKPRTMSQRTAPLRWCARTLEMDVKTMVAMDVAMAILTAISGAAPRALMISVRKGTITMPPPIPSRPAKKPDTTPKATSSSTRRGSSAML